MTDEQPKNAVDALPDGGAAAALDDVEERKLGHRRLSGWSKWVNGVIAATWTVFQLLLPRLVTLNSDTVRAIHLAFALCLVFLNFPALRRPRLQKWPLPAFLHRRDSIPVIDLLLGLLAAAAALYFIIDYEGIGSRAGAELLPRDYAFGIALLVLLLEAARRAFGPTLSVVALLFIVYGFTAELMPGVFSAKSVSVRGMVGRLTMTTEGVYGVPLGVSASTVFLFVFLGVLLERTGGGRYFVQLAFSLLGRFRGGPAKAAVCASGLTGMISGSSIANVVTTGTFTIPLMKKSGYPAEKAAAIEVAASTNGQLMPPIMGAAAFIIAEYCSVPYLTVVKAAFIPAVVSYLALIYITHLEACKLGLQGLAREETPQFTKVFWSGTHFLVPVILLVTLLLRGYSPSASVFYAIVLLVVLVLIHDTMRGARAGEGARKPFLDSARRIAGSFAGGGQAMMGVAVACAAAGIIVGVVGMGFGNRITDIVKVLSRNNIILILVFTAIASLIIGMGLPTTATYIVMASLTAQVIVDLGGQAGLVIPVIAAHLFCFFFGILADDTPPVGLAAYAGAAVAKSDPIKTGIQGFTYDLRTAILPFIFVFNTDLLLWQITSWWQATLVFAATTVAMFAFAALTQNFMAAKNRIHEAVLLGLCTLVMLRPRWLQDLLPRFDVAVDAGLPKLLASQYLWYAVGALLFGGVYTLQRLRRTP